MEYDYTRGTRDEFNDFKKLIDEVRTIDADAAGYLKTTVEKDDPSYCYADVLDEIFVWNDSRQGKEYWMNIHDNLMKVRYINLIEKVRRISPEGAEYMKDTSHFDEFEYSGRLSECFEWEATPQGHAFWKTIHDLLIEE